MEQRRKIYELFEEFDFSKEFEEDVNMVYADKCLNLETREEAEEYVEANFAESGSLLNITIDCETTYDTDIELDVNFEYLGRGVFKIRFFTSDLSIFINFLRRRQKNNNVSKSFEEINLLKSLEFFEKEI